jgi:hypothetical protein
MDKDVKSYRVWWDESNGIVRIDWTPGSVCTLAEAQGVLAEIAAMDRATPGVLVDIRQTGSINRPARELFKDSKAHSGCALLAGSAATRMMANFFLTLNRGPIPIRMFTSEVDAVDWLRAQR